MEIEQLDEAVDVLQDVIAEFPIGASALNDYKPIEEKIIDLRESLKTIDARHLTLKAIIDMGISEDNDPKDDLSKALQRLNESTTNYLMNTKTLRFCLQSRAIQDIIYDNAGTEAIQNKVKFCLNKLFLLNDKMTAKNEKRKELMKTQYFLKLKCHGAVYDYQDFLKEKETRRTEKLQEADPNFIRNKEKISRTIMKINTMKKLITNSIASMNKELDGNEQLVEMLAKHKEIISLETVTEIAQKSQNR